MAFGKWEKDGFPLTRSSPQAVLKVLARLKYSVPLYKTEDEFLILAEECLTFETVSGQHRQEKKQKKLPDDVKHTYIEAVLILSERKTGLEPATFGLGSQRSTS